MLRCLLLLCLLLPAGAHAFGPNFKGSFWTTRTFLFIGAQYGQLSLGSTQGTLAGAEVALMHALRGGDGAFVGGLFELGEVFDGETRAALGVHAGWAALAADISGIQVAGETGVRMRAHLNLLLLGLWAGAGRVGGDDLFEVGATLRLPIPL